MPLVAAQRDLMPRAPSLPLIDWRDIRNVKVPVAASLQPHALQRCTWAPSAVAVGGGSGHEPAAVVTGLPPGRAPAPVPSHCSIVTSGVPLLCAAATGGAGDSGAAGAAADPHDGDDFAASLRSAVEEFTAPDFMACYSDSEGGSSLWSTDTPTYPRLGTPPPLPQHVMVTKAAAAPPTPAPTLCTFVPTTAFPPTLPPLQQLRPAACGAFAAAPACYEEPPPAYQEKLAALMAAIHERPVS